MLSKKFVSSSFALFFVVILSVSALADLPQGSCGDAQKTQTTTTQTAVINGVSLAYQATTGFIEVTAADNSSKACVFYTSYTVNSQNSQRPITFAFNGGPGSASLWLHMGFMAPLRVDMGADGLTPPASLDLITNDYSPLDVTDIVMIDPVATGFSHTESGANTPFFGVKNDYTSVGAFVQNYLSLNDRWLSPKFILGESYGGIRGNLLVNYLQSSLNIPIDGLILISPAVSDLSFFESAADNLVPYWTFLPSFATTAWFHGKIGAQYKSLVASQVFVKAQAFAENRYRPALEMGSLIDNAEFNSVAQELSDWTGLPVSQIMNLNLRITDGNMFSGLLADSQMTIGRFDSRFRSLNLTHGGSGDPSDNATGIRYVPAINQYLRVNLGFKTTSPYAEFATIQDWPISQSDGIDTMVQLSDAMVVNPRLRVLVASGYFDLACPMGTVDYEIEQMPHGKILSSRISHTRYPSGHMLYLNPPVLAQLKSDVAGFIQKY